MDEPKLTLVTSPTCSEESCSNSNREFESEWLIDACDLEGVDAEEVEDEPLEEGIVISNENDWSNLESDNSAENDEGDENEQHSFQFTNCPECDSESCSRPVKELCGHVKCRQCFVTSEEACMQCLIVSGQETEKKKVKPCEKDAETIVPDQDDEEDNREIMIVKPNEYVFELGVSGKRSIAVVSSETLRELGIQNGACPVDGQTENSESNLQGVTSPPSQTTVCENPTNSSQHLDLDADQKSKKSKKVNTDHIILVESEAPESDDAPRKYKCLKCDKEFSQEYQRKYHVFCNTENGRRPFVCHCSEEFISQSHYLYHVRSKHTGEKPYECPVCAQRFIQKVKLNRHMITHTSKSSKSDEGSTYLCAYCKRTFTSLASCRRHIRNHTEHKPFSCDQCQKSFKQKYSLDMHKRTHLNQRPFKCPDCDSAFSTAKDMRRHHLCHTGEKPFQCAFENCNAKFRRKDNLERHIRQTHKLPDKMAKVLGQEAAKKYSEETRVSNDSSDVSSSHLNKKRKKKKKELLEHVVEIITGT